MRLTAHKPLLSNGKAYLNHHGAFKQVAKQLDNTPQDGFRPGGSMESQTDSVSNMTGEVITSFFAKDGNGTQSSLSQYSCNTNPSKKLLSVSDLSSKNLTPESGMIIQTDRNYVEDETDTLRVHERFDRYQPDGTSLGSTESYFLVDKTTGALTMLDGEQGSKDFWGS